MNEKKNVLFAPEAAINAYYRIPSLIKTGNGDLLAFADCRRFSCNDSPNRIDQCYKRSKDNGKTWSQTQVFITECGNSPQEGSAAIDGTALYDDENNVIYFLYNMTPAGVGALNSQKGMGVGKNGYFVAGGERPYFWKNNRISDENGVSSGYETDDWGNIRRGDEDFGNLKTNTQGLRLAPTSFLMLTTSRDNGYTWSSPVCLNESIKTENMGFLGPGPGIGIRVKRGKYKGRLIFPVYYSAGKQPSFMAAVIYSDDGENWKMSRPVIEYKSGIDEENVFESDSMCVTEAQVFERSDGGIVLYARNHDRAFRILEAVSFDGGETWEGQRLREDLPQCICQACTISFTDEKGKSYNVFVNPADEKIRTNGTLRLSEDEGATYPYTYRFADKEFIYSSAAYLGNGQIGILYEISYDTIAFTTLSIGQIKGRE